MSNLINAISRRAGYIPIPEASQPSSPAQSLFSSGAVKILLDECDDATIYTLSLVNKNCRQLIQSDKTLKNAKIRGFLASFNTLFSLMPTLGKEFNKTVIIQPTDLTVELRPFVAKDLTHYTWDSIEDLSSQGVYDSQTNKFPFFRGVDSQGTRFIYLEIGKIRSPYAPQI